ncbi:MAG TPA: cyclic nucleotide-binding domain-containing protein [Gammaproteobacteria bacterium]|nr:cyclic nucleotide-binding domain-containing protein [Gammaproteobacteria bacterium]
MITTNLFLNETDPKHFKAGEKIFSEGDVGDYMYGVIQGEVEIRKHGKVVDTVGPGGIFGEMALIDHTTRSATAVAKSDCNAAQINEKRFYFLVQQTPNFALHLLRVLTERLRHQSHA